MSRADTTAMLSQLVEKGNARNRAEGGKRMSIEDRIENIVIAAGTLGLKTPACLIDMSAKGKKPSKRLIKDFLEAIYSKEDAE